MSEYDNIECLRCGRQWYSDLYEEKGETPEHCPRCYRSEIRPIPEPPTKIDLLIQDLRERREKLPEKIQEKKHDLTIWKEQNRFMISMVETGAVMMLLVIGLIYALFFM